MALQEIPGDGHIVEVLENALQMAREGRIDGVLFIGLNEDSHTMGLALKRGATFAAERLIAGMSSATTLMHMNLAHIEVLEEGDG